MTEPKNIAVSVKSRLLNVARARHEDFNFVLSRYFQERLLYRLSQSTHAQEFVLKGAALFTLWQGNPHRPTKDTDFLGFGDPSPNRLTQVFRTITSMPCPQDGLVFDNVGIRAAAIREQALYDGIRVMIPVTLGTARSNMQIDVGFGDAATPEPIAAVFPTLLDLPAPTIRAYHRQTVVAEKFEAIVRLGHANSRMKDFFDLDILLADATIADDELRDAIEATFSRRGTPLPSQPPHGLTDAFAMANDKQVQWKAFTRKLNAAQGTPLIDIVRRVRQRLARVVQMPPHVREE